VGTVVTPKEEDQLLVDAIALAMDVRDDLAAAHRTIRHADRTQLERLTVALAAMVDPNIPLPVMAWWRVYAEEVVA
jgi:hypothetical protein